MRRDWPVAWMAVATLTPLLTLASVRLSSAQTVQGTVVDAESGVPIYTAEVALPEPVNDNGTLYGIN